MYTVSTIADVIMLDADLAPTNEDALYEVTGVVYGGDLDGNAGLSFTIIDATAGINVFNFTDVSEETLTNFAGVSADVFGALGDLNQVLTKDDEKIENVEKSDEKIPKGMVELKIKPHSTCLVMGRRGVGKSFISKFLIYKMLNQGISPIKDNEIQKFLTTKDPKRGALLNSITPLIS